LALIEQQYPHQSPNKSYPSEAAWLAFVDSTQIGSPERDFKAWVESNYPTGRSFYTFADADAFYDPAIHQVNGGDWGETWFFYHFRFIQVLHVGDHLTEPTINNSEFGWEVLGDGNTLTQAVFMGMPFPVPCTLVASF
jgi:hypothetical protein